MMMINLKWQNYIMQLSKDPQLSDELLLGSSAFDKLFMGLSYAAMHAAWLQLPSWGWGFHVQPSVAGTGLNPSKCEKETAKSTMSSLSQYF